MTMVMTCVDDGDDNDTGVDNDDDSDSCILV